MTTVMIPVKLPQLPPKAIRAFLEDAARLIVDKLRTAAQKNIRNANLASAYMNSLDAKKYPGVIEITDTKATVTLVSPPSGFNPNALEQGSGPWDMKPGMMKHAGADGYIDVQFRHGYPGAPASKTGAGGTKTPVYFKPVPKDILGELISRARQAGAGRATPPKGPESIGPRGPRGAPFKPTAWMMSPPKTPPVAAAMKFHKTSIYASMMHMSHVYEQAKGSKHVTVRRISRNSDASSWMHPGWKAIKLFELVKPDVEKFLSDKAADLFKLMGM